ncbi:hypothetical protein K435DRAFT_270125 [Dendrothele bispora CBS 962.96]|uniref:Uncharacterized protein n=1 Tax=Dendrothele bispora (strain CBS 962.96) TaxID=1314807 RepID=A0A4S8MLE1_DENBC|nr:hypothetical protein K435DRAFT_270125 [Dendrothele bispora CBS 962.96]
MLTGSGKTLIGYLTSSGTLARFACPLVFFSFTEKVDCQLLSWDWGLEIGMASVRFACDDRCKAAVNHVVVMNVYLEKEFPIDS